jgi:hypothetical protein
MQELAQKLKTQIEAARQAKTEYEKTGKSQGRGAEENVVVLTRMDRTGMIRPVSKRQHPMEPKKGRRKKKKVLHQFLISKVSNYISYKWQGLIYVHLAECLLNLYTYRCLC